MKQKIHQLPSPIHQSGSWLGTQTSSWSCDLLVKCSFRKMADGKLGMGELGWGCPVCSWGCHHRERGCLCWVAETGRTWGCGRQRGGGCAEPQPCRGKEVGMLHVGQGQGKGGLSCTWCGGLCFESWATQVLWTEGLLARNKVWNYRDREFWSFLLWFGARKERLFDHSQLGCLASSVLKTSFILLIVFVPHSSYFLWDIGFWELFKLHLANMPKKS